MPRWRALPEELDPQIAEFTEQLRRLIDRSGMSIATVADRTGYSKSSWERYLNGRLLPPRGATQGLAEITNTDPRHLGTLWELAERAWSRSEMRHDVTMEAIQVAQARAALAEVGGETGRGRKRRRRAGSSAGAAPQAPAGGESATALAGASSGAGASSESVASSGPGALSGSGGDKQTTMLRRPETRPTPEDAPVHPGERSSAKPNGASVGTGAPSTSAAGAAAPPAAPGAPQRIDPSTWGGQKAPGPAAASTEAPAAAVSAPANGLPVGGGSAGAGPPKSPGHQKPQPAGAGRRRVTMFLAGAVGALVVIAGAVLAFNVTGDEGEAATPPSKSPKSQQDSLPSGVKCSGQSCTGKDPEQMGCGGQYAKTAGTAWVGPSYVEVRHSTVCRASWARITSATTGDSLKISAGGHTEQNDVKTTNDAYTPMVATPQGSPARACATLAAGGQGCTKAQ